jgi:hypothetical protein
LKVLVRRTCIFRRILVLLIGWADDIPSSSPRDRPSGEKWAMKRSILRYPMMRASTTHTKWLALQGAIMWVFSCQMLASTGFAERAYISSSTRRLQAKKVSSTTCAATTGSSGGGHLADEIHSIKEQLKEKKRQCAEAGQVYCAYLARNCLHFMNVFA